MSLRPHTLKVSEIGRRRRVHGAAIVRGLAHLLQHPTSEGIARLTGGPTGDWTVVRSLITIHGLAPYLARAVDPDELASAMPPSVGAWLAEQATQNTLRIRRMHEELAAILGMAAERGIAIVPLKGALLTTLPGLDPYRRPMGDLDLLVRPADRWAMGELLVALGYRREPEANPRPTHDVYVDPGGGRVVSRDEHPDNPRRVEVHVELLRHLWGWLDEDRLTARMWAGARPGQVLGQPALVPAAADLLGHVAIHATADLLNGRGRLVQWLDLALLATHAGAIAGGPHPRLAYPALALARRTMSGQLSEMNLAELESEVPQRLVSWVRSVPLDDRCGLMVAAAHDVPHSITARVIRWAPSPWRLSVAYGDRSRPVALAMHARLVSSRWRGRVRYRAAHRES